MTWSFRTNGNYIDFVHTDDTSLHEELTVKSLHNTSRNIEWSLPVDITRINFSVDNYTLENVLITEIDFDGATMNEQADFETGIEAMFTGLGSSSSPGGSSYLVKTYAEIVTLIAGSGLVAGTLYKISDKGDRGLFFTAISTSQLAKDGTRLMLCPAIYSTNETDGNGNVWKGVWAATKNPDVDDLMIWGGKVWKNLTGDIGTATNNTALDGTNWLLISKSSFSNNEYIELEFGVNYDIVNDWIERQWDSASNVFGFDYLTEQFWGFGYNTCDVSDWNYNINNDSNIMFSNIGAGVWNNAVASIHTNTSPFGIFRNVCNNITQNRVNEISGNTIGGSINNNLMRDSISGNTCGGAIRYNSCKEVSANANTGNIEQNSNNGAIVSIGSGNANISHNTNNGDISTTTTGDITDIVVNK